MFMKNTMIKSILFGFIILIGCKGKQSIMDNETGESMVFVEKNFDPYFKGLGTEPFWNIQIDNDFIVYKDIDNVVEVFKINRIDKAQDANVQRIIANNEENNVLLTLVQQECSDGMSDHKFSFKVNMEISYAEQSLVLKGCGDFVVPEKLQATWELTTFDGNKIAKNQYLKTPFLTFDSEESKLSGNTSCNGISGEFYIQNNVIRFSKLAVTRMMCVHENMEQAFLEALQKVTNYKIVNDELQLFSDDILKMTMKKTTSKQ